MFIFEIQSVLGSCGQTGHTQFLTMSTQYIFDTLLIFVNLYQLAKNQLIPSVHSWDTVNSSVQRPDWPYPVLTKPNQKNFDQILIFVNLYQHAKNEALSLIYLEKKLI